ncbi:MAG TPA: carboxypeptidase regulatory-like domain-containing protein [Desulfatiglandales bacterium]|nr:carboxypeptidase regulatory-like domain-containing protein [Desulfatiglandales bacterium]
MKKLGVLCAALFMVFIFAGTAFSGYTYYLPYYAGQGGYWTGVAVANSSSTQTANMSATVYDENGGIQITENNYIAPNGQKAFAIGSALEFEGWMKVSSDVALTGLCFFGGTSFDYMADIPFIHTTSTSLFIPHVAQDDQWDTKILACNPNNSATGITITFVNEDGQPTHTKNYTLGANASGQYELETILDGGTAPNGKVVITATQGIAAFALYNNQKLGYNCYSGISAVDSSDQNPYASECLYTSSISVEVTSAITGAVIEGATVESQGQTATTDYSGVAMLSGLPGDIDVLVTVSASGYVTQPTTVTTVCGQNREISVSLIPEGDTGTIRGDIRIILTWGENPRDLDSHLAGPAADGSGNYHIYYSNRNNNGAGGPSDPNYPAWLDVDDTSSYGPETITIQKVTGAFIPGTYRYYVHHWTGDSNIPNSGAAVKVYEGQTLIGTYTPPNTSQDVGYEWAWKVFALTMASDGTYSISVLGEYFGPVDEGVIFASAMTPEGSQISITSEDYELFRDLPRK